MQPTLPLQHLPDILPACNLPGSVCPPPPPGFLCHSWSLQADYCHLIHSPACPCLPMPAYLWDHLVHATTYHRFFLPSPPGMEEATPSPLGSSLDMPIPATCCHLPACLHCAYTGTLYHTCCHHTLTCLHCLLPACTPALHYTCTPRHRYRHATALLRSAMTWITVGLSALAPVCGLPAYTPTLPTVAYCHL